MSIYTIPAMSLQNEFTDLTWLGKYVDNLVATTGDRDYAVAYEWGEHGPGDWPPLAVLFRVDADWVRRDVLVTVIRDKSGACRYEWQIAPVNGH